VDRLPQDVVGALPALRPASNASRRAAPNVVANDSRRALSAHQARQTSSAFSSKFTSPSRYTEPAV
jgi:hypothetical protein